jgi:CrcB protein
MTAAAVAAVGIGAALGAWLRWGLAIAFNAGAAGVPLGTLAANVIGGFLIGVAMEVFGRSAGLSEELRLLVITGFLGGLTTFSTFSAEVIANLLRGHWGWALAIAASHLAGSLLATWIGILCVRWVSGG